MADAEAAKYVDGVGFHWYSTMYGAVNTYPRLSETHSKHPNLFLLGTEACEGFIPVLDQGPKAGLWDRAAHYASDILKDLENHAVGWTDWNLILDVQGGPNWAKNVVDAPLLLPVTSVDAPRGSVGSFVKNTQYYAMAHFSKYLPPGSSRIQQIIKKPLLSRILSTAFVTPNGRIVVIVVNNGDDSIVSIGVGGSSSNLSILVAADSINTIVLPSSLGL